MKELSFEEYDLIVHTGDIIDKSNSDIEKYHIDFLTMLKSKYGKFYVQGNHENYDDKKELEKIMGMCGFKNLTNNYIELEIEGRKIFIAGLDDSLFGFPDSSSFESKIPKDSFNIAVMHNLDAFEKFFFNKFNLVLSGHLHSGEINFGFFDGIDYMIKFNKHYFNLNQHKKGIKFLTESCLSLISPGMHTHVKAKYRVPRFFTDKEGPVEISVKF
jgi:predicted MPP superfamily phosphohydrolase